MTRMKRMINLVVSLTLLFVSAGIVVRGAEQSTGAASGTMKSAFTPEKIEQDLIGRSVGPDASVKVRTGTGTDPSYSVYTTVPLGVVFDSTNILGVRVLDIKRTEGKAQVVVYVDTVSIHAGRLRLYYELIAGEWTLMEIENLDFRLKE